MSLVYKLKIILKDAKPKVMRRFLVSGSCNLRKIHNIIQVVMTWEHCHMHEFRINEFKYNPIRELDTDDLAQNELDERKHTFESLNLKKGDNFLYVYDFGDNRRHELIVEDVVDLKTLNVVPPLCLEMVGKPVLEDSASFGGYEGIKKILKNPKYPNYAEIKENFEEEFNFVNSVTLDSINKKLEEFK